jgi:hypothetical protein
MIDHRIHLTHKLYFGIHPHLCLCLSLAWLGVAVIRGYGSSFSIMNIYKAPINKKKEEWKAISPFRRTISPLRRKRRRA